MWMTESAIKFCSRLMPFQNSDPCPMYQMDFLSLKKFAKAFLKDLKICLSLLCHLSVKSNKTDGGNVFNATQWKQNTFSLPNRHMV